MVFFLAGIGLHDECVIHVLFDCHILEQKRTAAFGLWKVRYGSHIPRGGTRGHIPEVHGAFGYIMVGAPSDFTIGAIIPSS